MIRRTSLLFFATGLVAVPLLAQSGAAAPASTAASAGATTMKIPFTVRDKHDKLIPNLTKDNFTLMVDGKPQAIESVSSAKGLPLTVGLVEQTSLTQQGSVEAERMGSKSFLENTLKSSDDKAFVIQFDREVDLLADVSANKAKLESALNQIGTPQTQNTGAAGDSGSHRIGGSGTTLYDAIYLASNEVIAKQPGRKVLIVVTDGVDRGSKVSLFQAVEAAQRANAEVYAIYVKGEESRGGEGGARSHRRVSYPGSGYPGGGYPGGGYPGGGYPGGGGGWPGGGGGNRPTARPTEGSRIDGRKILIQICSETGGRMFEAGKKASIDALSQTIANELNARYMLQFTPDKQSEYGGFHRVALMAKKKDYYVQARQGYYGNE